MVLFANFPYWSGALSCMKQEPREPGVDVATRVCAAQPTEAVDPYSLACSQLQDNGASTLERGVAHCGWFLYPEHSIAVHDEAEVPTVVQPIDRCGEPKRT